MTAVLVVMEFWYSGTQSIQVLSHVVCNNLKVKAESKGRKRVYKNHSLNCVPTRQCHTDQSHIRKAMGGAAFSQPWRTMPNTNQENLDFMDTYKPHNYEATHLRILLHGPVGAGKSSFINSVDSVFKGRLTSQAPTDATSGTSFTMRYKTYKIRKDTGSIYSFVFNDLMGLEDRANTGVHVEDLKLALMGHVREGYQFDPKNRMQKGDQFYNPSPTLNDRVHVLVSVIPADSVSLLSQDVVKKMRDVRLAASEMGVPQMTILTKVDEACPQAKKDINNVYKSKYLKEQIDKFSQMLGLPLNCIFPVKNYETEISTNEGTDALILCALRQMITYGEDFLNNLLTADDL